VSFTIILHLNTVSSMRRLLKCPKGHEVLGARFEFQERLTPYIPPSKGGQRMSSG
jgi:hypothetical protein